MSVKRNIVKIEDFELEVAWEIVGKELIIEDVYFPGTKTPIERTSNFYYASIAEMRKRLEHDRLIPPQQN